MVWKHKKVCSVDVSCVEPAGLRRETNLCADVAVDLTPLSILQLDCLPCSPKNHTLRTRKSRLIPFSHRTVLNMLKSIGVDLVPNYGSSDWVTDTPCVISHHFYLLNFTVMSETIQIFSCAEISDTPGCSEGARVAQLPVGWRSRLWRLRFDIKTGE